MTEAGAPERFVTPVCTRLTVSLLVAVITFISLAVCTGAIAGNVVASGITYLFSGKRPTFEMWENFVITFLIFLYWITLALGALLIGSVLLNWSRMRLPGVAWLVSVALLNVLCVILIGAYYELALIGGTLTSAALALFVWISRFAKRAA